MSSFSLLYTQKDGTHKLRGVTHGDTAANDTDTTQLATTEFVKRAVSANSVSLESPALTGTPTAPTATQGTNSTQVATTEYVEAGIDTLSTQIDQKLLPIVGNKTPKIDARSLHNGNVTVQLANGTAVAISADGILWGRRFFNYIITNTLVIMKNRTHPDHNMIGFSDGNRGSTDSGNSHWWPSGYVIYQFRQSYAMRYNAFYMFLWVNISNLNWDFGIYASNDRAVWTELKTLNFSMSEYTNGATSSTQTLGGTSITFPGRTTSDSGATGTPVNSVRRYTFANDNYYQFYMIKWIGVGSGVELPVSYEQASPNNQHEWEWG